jgi:DMSO/TMAO reductase YedYZ molybdopterin-dependent catalytic subunit
MAVISRGFHGRPRPGGGRLPPGQHETRDFPVLSSGPTPRIDLDTWEFVVTTEAGVAHSWNWAELTSLPAEEPMVDLHCVTKWSRFGTRWRGVSLDVLLADVETTARFALVRAYGGYTTNLPLEDLRGGKAWIAYDYDGKPLAPQHGGPARLLVPHLYLWKSAKWVRRLELLDHDELGFWERNGYHHRGDPWHEERHSVDDYVARTLRRRARAEARDG